MYSSRSAVVAGTSARGLVCPYHAWEYDATEQCVRIPAHPQQTPPVKARAQAYQVRERYGMVWVCLGEALAGVPEWLREIGFTYGTA